MGENTVAVFYERKAKFRDGLAHGDVLPVDGDGFFTERGCDGGRVRVGHGVGPPSKAVQRPAQVHRRGAGGVEVLGQTVEFRAELGGGKVLALLRQGGQTVPGADADGRGPPDPQEPDGLEHLLRLPEGQVFYLVGQQGLVQDDHAGAVVPQADVAAEIL